MTVSTSESTPLTFDLKDELREKLTRLQEKLGVNSTSEVIRTALSRYRFQTFSPESKSHRQISVRLPASMKLQLLRTSRQKKVSVGELIRAALETLSRRSADAESPRKTKTNEHMAKKAAKRKAAKKKVAKKKAPARKRAPAKKKAAKKKK